MNKKLILPFSFLICLSSAFSQSSYVETIYFKSNSFSIDTKYENSLNHVAKDLTSDAFVYLKIFAYADKSGSEDYNNILSQKRADAVYNYLAARSKFDTTKVFATGIGESSDVYDLHFPGAHKQQRCVDIWIQLYRKPK